MMSTRSFLHFEMRSYSSWIINDKYDSTFNTWYSRFYDEILNFHLMTRFMLFRAVQMLLNETAKNQKSFVPLNNYSFKTRAAMLLIFHSLITGKFNYNWIIMMIIVIVGNCDQSNASLLDYRFWLWVCTPESHFRSNKIIIYVKSRWNSSTWNKNSNFHRMEKLW